MTIKLTQQSLQTDAFHAVQSVSTRRLVLIDAAIASPEVLAAGVLPGSAVEMLAGDRDGIKQITEALQRHPGTESLHLISHGASGAIFVGNTELTLETLSLYSSQLLSWADLMAPDAGLLIYGCEVAKDERGRSFIARLSELTGASIAASATKTGAAALDGDWKLEVQSGVKPFALAFRPELMTAYASVLTVAGSLDPTFGSGGKVTTSFFGGSNTAFDAVQQSDGKLVVSGLAIKSSGDSSDFALSRYNRDGSLDTTFGTNGKVTTDFNGFSDAGYSVTQQSDGKLVVAGQAYNGPISASATNDFALSRYNSDGSLDTTFGNNGKVTTDFNGLSDNGRSVAQQQRDGKIVVAGYLDSSGGNIDFALSRYNSDGSLDTTFGNNGKVTTDFNSAVDYGYDLTLQSDGKIVVAGSVFNASSGNDFALSRYNRDGSLDTAFGTNGKVTTDFSGSGDTAYSVTLQNDGKIVVAGAANDSSPNTSDIALSRYNSDGRLDTTFGNNGKVITDLNGLGNYAQSVNVQSDGKIVVSGTTAAEGNTTVANNTNSDFTLSRYNSNGSLDTTFGYKGKVTTDFSGYVDTNFGATIQSDGNIVLVGTSGDASTGGSKFTIARYLGAPDSKTAKNDFNSDGKTDVVVRNKATGDNAVAILDGTIVSDFVFFQSPVAGPNWTIDGAGDFDKDGKPDIVLRNSKTGQNAISLMDGTTNKQVVSPEILPDPNWGIGGVGDFNNDGNLDILYRNKATGANSIALMNGTNLSQLVSTDILPGLDWEIGGAGDFNSDGKDDILFRNTATGANSIALMNGTELGQIVSTEILPDPNWRVGSVGDYNRDGKTDILYRNQSTGQNIFALMDGTSLSTIELTRNVTDTNWQIGA
jgi:uncharacterized delta-60 repeat protein